jgi:hypothetical protein
MWLTIARSNAAPSETWIMENYESALKQSTDDDRVQAEQFLARWRSTQRD